MIREKIENRLKVTCDDIDFTTLTDIEFYVKQIGFFECYIPIVISEHEMVVNIPFEHAKRLRSGTVQLQFAFTDAEGNPRASDVVTETVKDLLKEVGYDPL